MVIGKTERGTMYGMVIFKGQSYFYDIQARKDYTLYKILFTVIGQ